MTTVHLYQGDAREVLKACPDGFIDAIVTDPPYELGFMGKTWDASGVAYSAEMWAECLRVLKPGGHLLAFGGTRTYHRMTVAIEDAGFEIRDSIHWIYGSGFPKSLNVSKAIDKAAGAERGRYARAAFGGTFSDDGGTTYGTAISDEPATPDAATWSGWGTALKPAHEPIVVARKPFAGTVAANVLAHGTGALNIDRCRVGIDLMTESRMAQTRGGVLNANGRDVEHGNWQQRPNDNPATHTGRWPANVVFDEDAAAELDAQSGGASRFFYCVKAPSKERPVAADGTKHATVKPLALMRWLVRLVTPPGGTVLDPFAGSGTTLEAALLEGFDCIGIERDAAHVELCQVRVERSGGHLSVHCRS